MAECKIIASGADNLAPRMAEDPFSADPNPAIATDPELEAQIARDLAERNAAYKDGQP